jgi:hypothetical protein
LKKTTTGACYPFLAEQVSNVVAGLCVYPLDTIRRYQIVSDHNLRSSVENISRHGISGFFGGFEYYVAFLLVLQTGEFLWRKIEDKILPSLAGKKPSL